MKNIIKPGYFSINVAADSRRGEFDCKNQVLIEKEIPVDFVFIGDSITAMWELNAYFNKPNQLIINRGIGGDTTEYLLKRFAADVIQLKPKHCIMKIGVNDAWDIEFDVWKQTDGITLEEVIARATSNISEIISLSKKNNQPLIVCSVLPTNMSSTNKESLRKQYIKLLNNNISRLCNENDLIFVDYYSKMVDQDGLSIKEDITMEGLHPNVYGYDIMYQVLTETLEKHNIII